MTQPSGSFVRTEDASGSPLAVHAVGSLEFPVGMIAGPTGHIEGTLPTYFLAIPPIAVGASKLMWDLFNADATALMKIRGIWVIVAQDVANAAAVSVREDWFRTSAVGTGGTAASRDANTIVPNLTMKDTTNAALPAGITARSAPTGGATSDDYLFPSYHAPEELQVHGGLSQFLNVLPDPSRGEQEMTFRQNQGIKMVQGTVAGAGNIGALVEFTVET
jgi:hypothetical protein